MQLVKSDCDVMATFAQCLAKALETEVILPLREFLKEEKKMEKAASKEWYREQEKYNDGAEELKRCRNECFKASEKFNEAAGFYEETNPKVKSVADKKRNTQKVYQLYASFKNLEKSYKTKYLDVRTTHVGFIKAMASTASKYQAMEESRSKAFKEKLSNYFTRKAELVRTLKSKFESNYSQTTGQTFGKEEVGEIAAKIMLRAKEFKCVEYEKPSTKHEEMCKKFDEIYLNGKSLEGLNTSEFKAMFMSAETEDEESEFFRQVLTTVWNTGKLAEEKKHEYREHMKSESGRIKFCEVFNMYRAQGIFMVTLKGYEELAKLLKLGLDEIEKAEDIVAALRTLILLQTYYAEMTSADGRTKKCFLQHKLRNHPLWSKPQFWEKAIIDGIEEDKKINYPDEIKKERENILKSSIFGKLGTFAQNMLEFGIEKEKVTSIIMSHAKESKLPEEFIISLNVSLCRDK